jgi:choline dehydrogenase-like flavoprotein
MVAQVLIEAGRAAGVRLADGSTEHAPIVVACAGAIETARLLLLSGVTNDHLGRHLQGHTYVSVGGLMPEPVWDGIGPGPSVATLDFCHDNPDVIAGAMLADDFIPLPVIFAKRYVHPDVPAWGRAFQTWVRDAYPRFVLVQGPVHEVPHPEARVRLDPAVRDRNGLPVAHLSGTTHPETLRTHAALTARAHEWLRASGAETTWHHEIGLWLSGGQHQAGTCRMGLDPSTSVTDPFGQVHGAQGLWVADGSLHPTNGAFNPVLTIMALAFRVSRAITCDAS